MKILLQKIYNFFDQSSIQLKSVYSAVRNIITAPTFGRTVNNSLQAVTDNAFNLPRNLLTVCQVSEIKSLLLMSLRINSKYIIPIIIYQHLLWGGIFYFWRSQFTIQVKNVLDFGLWLLYCRWCLRLMAHNFFIYFSLSSIDVQNKYKFFAKSCDCSAAKKVENFLHSSLNFAVDQVLLYFSYFLPVVGRPVYYSLYFLYVGNNLLKARLADENLCYQHQNKYLALHNSYAFGLGASYNILLLSGYYIVSRVTQVNNFLLYDALANFLYHNFLIGIKFSKCIPNQDLYKFEVFGVLGQKLTKMEKKYNADLWSNILQVNFYQSAKKLTMALWNFPIINMLQSIIVPEELKSIDGLSQLQSFQILCYLNYSEMQNFIKILLKIQNKIDNMEQYYLLTLTNMVGIARLMYSPVLIKLIFFLASHKIITEHNLKPLLELFAKANNRYISNQVNNIKIYSNRAIRVVPNHFAARELPYVNPQDSLANYIPPSNDSSDSEESDTSSNNSDIDINFVMVQKDDVAAKKKPQNLDRQMNSKPEDIINIVDTYFGDAGYLHQCKF